jgi:hypothetical protein
LHAGLHGLTEPELHYWLSTNQSAGASLQPSRSNTVFVLPDTPDPGLQLKPPTGPGKDSRGGDAGGLVRPKAHAGWSLADVQVSCAAHCLQCFRAHAHCAWFQVGVQAHQVLRELHKFQDAPLVYIGHPVSPCLR